MATFWKMDEMNCVLDATVCNHVVPVTVLPMTASLLAPTTLSANQARDRTTQSTSSTSEPPAVVMTGLMSAINVKL